MEGIGLVTKLVINIVAIIFGVALVDVELEDEPHIFSFIFGVIVGAILFAVNLYL